MEGINLPHGHLKTLAALMKGLMRAMPPQHFWARTAPV